MCENKKQKQKLHNLFNNISITLRVFINVCVTNILVNSVRNEK